MHLRTDWKLLGATKKVTSGTTEKVISLKSQSSLEPLRMSCQSGAIEEVKTIWNN